MQQAKTGDTVKVHYRGSLTNGTVFDSSEGKNPLQFELGKGMVIVGFDNGVKGMSIGEKKTVQIPVNEAYGPKQSQLIIDVNKKDIPSDIDPKIGMQLHMTTNNGDPIPVTIAEIKEASIVLDANHPLAGEDLIFDIELIEIV